MKVDIHTNLSWFPTSKSSDTRVYASVQQMADFLNVNEVTVNFCLYPRDGYHMLEKLAEITPHIKHIGVQVLMGAEAADATAIESVMLDVNNSIRTFKNGGLCHGIKIASHRGWWNRKGEVDSGFDYGRGDCRQLTKWLRSMPDGAICSMHMQGDPIQNSASIPTTFGMYAYANGRIVGTAQCSIAQCSAVQGSPTQYLYIQMI